MELLSETELNSFNKYKYKSIDNTLTSKIYSKCWNKIVQFIPKNLHPYFLTIAGILSVFISYNLFTRHHPF